MLRQGSNPELTLATVFGVSAGQELDGGIGHGHSLPGIEVAAQTKHRGHGLLLPGRRTVSGILCTNVAKKSCHLYIRCRY